LTPLLTLRWSLPLVVLIALMAGALLLSLRLPESTLIAETAPKEE